MADIPEPIDANHFDNDLHALNKEILHLASVLQIDLNNQTEVVRVLEYTPVHGTPHFHALTTLRGLLLLRGHMREQYIESGNADGPSPLEDAAQAAKKP